MSVVGSILETSKGNQMHTLQWIAIKVEDGLDDPEQEAMEYVESFLNNELNPGSSWYDWFVIGGGRWNPEQDPYSSSSNMIISYAKDPEIFAAKIDSCIESRLNEFKNYVSRIDFDSIKDKLDIYTGNIDYSFDLYPLSKAIDMLQGNWDFNSKYFDAEHSSTNTKHMLDKLPTEGVDWYLVPVDFHF
jgi:hypothetical protein